MSRRSCRLRSAGILDKLVTIVRCPCKVDKYEGLMILCDECGFWQHGPCFTIIGKQYVPAKHCCNTCADSPSKCTDPRICLPNSNMVQASCLYRRTLVLLYSHKGQMTPARIARLLDVDIAIGSSIIDKLLSEKILKFAKSKLSCIIDRKNLLYYAFPKYLNKVVQQVPINTDVNIAARFGKNNVVSHDKSIVEDVVEANTDSPSGGYENDDMNNEVVKIEFKSSLPIKKFIKNCDSNDENESSERKVFDVDQITPVKEINSLSYIGKDGIKTRDISADAKVARLFEVSPHCNSVTIADAIADDDVKKTLLYNHSSIKEKRNDENELNSFEIIKRDQSSAKEINKLACKGKDGIKTTDISDDEVIVRLFEAPLHGNSVTVADSKAADDVNNFLLYKHSTANLDKQNPNDENELNSIETLKVGHTSAEKLKRLNRKRLRSNALQEKTNEKLSSVRSDHTKIECSFCKQIFHRKSNLTVHINRIHSQVYQCPQCEFSINDSKIYLMHVSSHTSYVFPEKKNAKIVCSYCNTIFSRRNNLTVHIAAFHSQVYQCSQCEFSIIDKKKYLKHALSHTKYILQEKKKKKLPSETIEHHAEIECPFCNHIFSRSHLGFHIDQVHSQVYQCSQCEFSINDRNKYLLHITSHQNNIFQETTNEKSPSGSMTHQVIFECSVCNRIFRSKHNLSVHIDRVHSQVYQCTHCEFSINDRNKYLKHAASHVRPKCSLCHKTFVNKDKLNVHVSCVHEKLKNFKCSLCDFVSFTQSNLRRHVRAVHQKLKPFKCTLCISSFSKRDHLNSHIIAVHRKEKRLKCLHCDFSASFTKNLSAHMLAMHNAEDGFRSFKCTNCTKSYGTKWQLNAHVSAVHDKSKFKCNDCSYVTGYKKNLTHHFRVFHENQKAYKCSLCRYCSDDENELNTHVSDFHAEKLFKCNECGYNTKYKYNLQCHIRAVHLKCRPFQCDECGFTTISNGNLKCHIRALHLKLKPFQCDECNYTFSEKKTLDYHIRAIHLKRLQCSQCEFTCNGERELFVHTNAGHEKIDPYQCDDCGYVSNYKWNVVCHMRSAHKK